LACLKAVNHITKSESLFTNIQCTCTMQLYTVGHKNVPLYFGLTSVFLDVLFTFLVSMKTGMNNEHSTEELTKFTTSP